MPWSDSRSREYWLAEVKRRGDDIRTRRRLILSAVGAVVLLVPVLALATLAPSGTPDRQLQVAAGGAAPTSSVGEGDPPSVLGGQDVIPTTTVLTGSTGQAESISPSGALFSTTTTEVHRRVSAINGVQEPSPPTTPTTRADDPVVRPVPPPATTATVVSGPPATGNTASSAGSGGSGAAGPATTVPPGSPALAACPASEVRVTVSIERSKYAPGEIVRFSSTLTNHSASTCLVSGRAFFSVEDGNGKVVGSFAYTADFMLPVKAEPGQAFTNTGTWDQRDCSGPACVQVPTGRYAVVAGWTEGGPYTGRSWFEIGA